MESVILQNSDGSLRKHCIYGYLDRCVLQKKQIEEQARISGQPQQSETERQDGLQRLNLAHSHDNDLGAILGRRCYTLIVPILRHLARLHPQQLVLPGEQLLSLSADDKIFRERVLHGGHLTLHELRVGRRQSQKDLTALQVIQQETRHYCHSIQGLFPDLFCSLYCWECHFDKEII